MTVHVTIALDWTPNTNHTGFYVAKQKGWYADAGLDLKIVSPHMDEYKTTPASRIADGSCLFCVTPSESIISAHTWGNAQGVKPKLVAVATLLQVIIWLLFPGYNPWHAIPRELNRGAVRKTS